MSKRKITFRSESDWQEVQRILEENLIPYNIFIKEDTAFPGLIKPEMFELIILEKDFNQFTTLTDNKFSSEFIQVNKKEKKSSCLFTILLLGYSLLMTLLFFKYYNIFNRNKGTDKNFVYSWSYDNTALMLKHKQTNEVVTVYIDKNRNYNYERIENYVGNKLMLVSIDKNEDGFMEKHQHYNTLGKTTGEDIDLDGDGLFEQSKIILEDGSVLNFIDKNKNGMLELVKE